MRRISSSKRNALAIDMAVAISEPAILSRIPFDQIRIEHLLSRADDVHHVLALTPEQSAFWRETASTLRSMLRQRAARREQWQSAQRESLQKNAFALPELFSQLEREEQSGATENIRMRDLCLVFYETLSQHQRHLLHGFLSTQVVSRHQPSDRLSKESQGMTLLSWPKVSRQHEQHPMTAFLSLMA